MQLKVGTKIFSGFIVVLLLFGGISAYGVTQVLSLSTDISSMSRESNRIVTTGEIRFNLAHQVANILVYASTGDESHLEEYQTLDTKNNEMEKELIASASTEEGKKLSQALMDQEDGFNQIVSDKVIPLVRAKNFTGAASVVDAEVIPQADKAYTAAQNYIEYRVNKNTEVVNTANAAAKTAGSSMIILSLISLILGLIIAFIITKMITKPIILLNEGALAIGEGDLTRDIQVKSKDEIGALAATFNKMSTELRNMTRGIIDTAQTLSSSSEELSATSEQTSAASEQVAATISQLAAGAAEQAKAVEKTNTVINDMSATTHQVATSADAVSESSKKVADMAKNGVVESENATKKIKRVEEATAETAQVIDKLGDESKHIGEIVNVITGIAEQTNLLALNAAIEAARAGEQGRGFAVVAEEVRKLAEQSAGSAAQIAGLVSNIQLETERAISVMGKSKAEVAAGVEAVKASGAAFQIIVNEIHQVVEQIQQVSAASQQMATDAKQAVQSVASIAAISEQTAAGTQEVSATAEEQTASMEEVASAAQELAILGEKLQSAVAKFKV